MSNATFTQWDRIGTVPNRTGRIGFCLHGTVFTWSGTGPVRSKRIRFGPVPERSRVNRRPTSLIVTFRTCRLIEGGRLIGFDCTLKQEVNAGSNGPLTKMLLLYVGASDSQKQKYKDKNCKADTTQK